MAEKQSKLKAKVKPKKSVADKKEAKVDLSQQLEELNENLKQEKDKYLRLFAEFENFKKRTTKERIELFRTAGRVASSCQSYAAPAYFDALFHWAACGILAVMRSGDLAFR